MAESQSQRSLDPQEHLSKQAGTQSNSQRSVSHPKHTRSLAGTFAVGGGPPIGVTNQGPSAVGPNVQSLAHDIANVIGNWAAQQQWREYPGPAQQPTVGPNTQANPPPTRLNTSQARRRAPLATESRHGEREATVRGKMEGSAREELEPIFEEAMGESTDHNSIMRRPQVVNAHGETRVAIPEGWADRINAKIEELVRWKEQGNLPVIPKIAITPPFTPRIMNEPLPADFKPPSIQRFDGVGDPQEHILTYQAAMMLMGTTEAVMCRAFFATLEGSAQRWFTNLTGGSIDSFHDLAMRFTTHFMRGRKNKKHFTYLTTVKQKVGETLTDFLTRWRIGVAEVDEMEEKSTIIIFVEALRAGDLYKSLKRKTPSTYVALMAKVDRYAEAEEANQIKREEEDGPSKRSRIEEAPEPNKKVPKQPTERHSEHNRRALRAGSPTPNRTPRLFTPMLTAPRPLTPLTARPSEVLAYAEEYNMVQLPRPSTTEVHGVDKSKYCRFHKRHGHDTDECHTLKREIEILVQSGELSGFIDWEKLSKWNIWTKGNAEPASEFLRREE